MQSRTNAPASQRRETIAVRADDPAGDRSRSKPWRTRVDPSMFDSRTCHRDVEGKPIGFRKLGALTYLDWRCRNKCYCWIGNKDLSGFMGCNVRRVQILLKEMEEDGLLVRYLTETGRPGRVGIILQKRIDETLPVAGDDSVLKLAKASLQDQRDAANAARAESASEREGPGETARGRRKAAPSIGHRGRRKAAPGRKTQSLSWNKDEIPEEDRIHSDSRRRQEPESEDTPREAPTPMPPTALVEPPPIPAATEATPPPPTPVEVPPAPTAEPVASRPAPAGRRAWMQFVPGCEGTPSAPAVAPSPPAPESAALTPSQIAWRDALPPERRARFDALSPPAQARLLDPHRAGLNSDLILEGEAARILGPRTSVPDLPGPEADVPELVRALAGLGHYRGKVVVFRCVQALVVMLGDKEPVSRRFFEKLCDEVAQGTRPPEGIIEPFEKTLAAWNDGGKKLNKLGAYFTRSVQNWDKEHVL